MSDVERKQMQELVDELSSEIAKLQACANASSKLRLEIKVVKGPETLGQKLAQQCTFEEPVSRVAVISIGIALREYQEGLQRLLDMPPPETKTDRSDA